jgi:hypothetical protein
VTGGGSLEFRPVTRTPTTLAAVLAAALLLTGCVRDNGPKPRGNRPTPSGSRTPIPTPDVCTVAPADKVFVGTGHTVEKIEGRGHVCTYELSGGLRVFAQYDLGPIETVKAAIEKALHTTAVTIPGLGKEAYGLSGRTASITSASILAEKNPGGLVVNVGMAGPGSDVSIAKPIAMLMIAALTGQYS